MIVLENCMGGDFSIYVLGPIVLGILVCWLLRLSGRGCRRMALVLALIYGISEFFATAVHDGHLTGLGAVLLGMLSLGMCLGSLLRWGFLALRGRVG